MFFEIYLSSFNVFKCLLASKNDLSLYLMELTALFNKFHHLFHFGI